MSIRDNLRKMVAAHTPPGGNVNARTRSVMSMMIRHYYPQTAPVDESLLAECLWEDATDWIYLGNAHAIIIGGQVTSLQYGQSLDAFVAREARAAGQRVVPINPSAKLPVTDAFIASQQREVTTPKRRRHQRPAAG